MKFVDEFKDKQLAKGLFDKIYQIAESLPFDQKNPAVLMEVCGTHTMALFKTGIRSMLPKNIKVVAGPGCPVCISSQSSIDKAIELSKEAIITTYGDMIRVPGTRSSLDKEKAKGADVRVVYSPLDALKIAKDNPEKQVVFLGVGFETTTSPTAATIIRAKNEKLTNFSVLSLHRIIPPALDVLSQGKLNINGYLCPGHVSTVIGEEPYDQVAKKYKIPSVIAGFEALDILEGIYLLLKQIRDGQAKAENAYKRAVKKEGNLLAKKIVDQVFEIVDADWRGIGVIPKSGLAIRESLSEFDAEKRFTISVEEAKPYKGCKCGEVLKGLIAPPECANFAKACTPENPLGPCMVSSEGACAAYHRYGGLEL